MTIHVKTPHIEDTRLMLKRISALINHAQQMLPLWDIQSLVYNGDRVCWGPKTENDDKILVYCISNEGLHKNKEYFDPWKQAPDMILSSGIA